MISSSTSTMTSTFKTTDTATALRQKNDINFAKKGIYIGLLGGMLWAIASIFLLGNGVKNPEFSKPEVWLLAPFFAAGIHDTCGAITTLISNIYRGQHLEIIRTIKTKSGRLCILGGFLGAPLGMGGYLISVSMIDPAYVLPITSLYPAVAAILAMLFLKEKINKRTWCGLLGCILGVFTISFVAPTSGTSDYFYLGLLFAIIAACGWASEGVVITAGMDFVEPGIALNIYQITSSCIYWLILIPLAGFITLPNEIHFSDCISSFFNSSGLYLIMLAGSVGAMSYLCWYKAMNTTGVSRAMALNITYSLWGVIFSAIFSDTAITFNLVLGAIIIFLGMILVIGNPKDMINLRQVN